MRVLQSTHSSMSKEQSIQPHPLEMLQQVIEEIKLGLNCALHCEGVHNGHRHRHGHMQNGHGLALTSGHGHGHISDPMD